MVVFEEQSDKLSHFNLGENAISIDVKLVEESGELRDSCGRLSSLSQEVVHESEGLASIKSSTAVSVVSKPDVVDGLNDIILAVLATWNVSEHFEKPRHLAL